MGTSARTMLDYSADEDKVITFDVDRLARVYATTYLKEEDFDERLTQHLVDLKETANFNEFSKMLYER